MTWDAGDLVTADDLSPLAAYKPTTTDRDTTTTPTADPDLTVPVDAGAVYVGRLVLYANSAVSNSGDLSLRWAFPSAASIAWGLHGVTDAITSGVSADLTAPEAEGSSSPSGALSVGLSSSFSLITAVVWLQTTTTAGSLTLQWAQASSSGNASRVRAGSHLVLERIG